uniref:G-protein coupled receptors family 1 profile domain-containing protein n=1 Tax=Biomphalaria glabrata TaxID=6526 RepID=A0A2C9LCI7_BIOGL
MGIPEYFTLETLYIENVEMTNIKENFFRGLTIKSELRASDYKLCCPQILSLNISADKCHAPVDAISSCKHLVGDILKRITIWTVGLITLVGNGIVLVYRIEWDIYSSNGLCLALPLGSTEHDGWIFSFIVYVVFNFILFLFIAFDFMCWFPVGILGFLSLKGHIFDREVYAWIAVFVLPINSALNPIIYTIPAIYQK